MSSSSFSPLSPRPSPLPTLAVLAGGAGSRMGKPKALLTIGEKPILSWLIEKLQWPGPTLLVTAPAIVRPAGSEFFSAEATDPVDGNGPLQGVHTGLSAAKTELVVFTTVDMPNLDRPKLQWLVEQLGEHAGVMCRRGEQIEPFPCVLRKPLVERIEQRLKEGRRSVYGLSFEADVRTLEAPPGWPADTWLNLNRPEDLATFEAE